MPGSAERLTAGLRGAGHHSTGQLAGYLPRHSPAHAATDGLSVLTGSSTANRPPETPAHQMTSCRPRRRSTSATAALGGRQCCSCGHERVRLWVLGVDYLALPTFPGLRQVA